jgi:SNF2 family DNA or RNA helicase
MGLGKTVQAIEAARRLEVRRPIVVCPASAVENWRREWRRWGSGVRLGITSYSRLIRHHKRVKRGRWDLVILDEAHYCKTPSAQRARRALELARDSDNAWLLSGTPMPNDSGELWAPFKYLWPEFPAQYGITQKVQWLDAFAKCRQTRYGAQPYAVKNAHLLKPFLHKIMLRRKWQEVGLDLPPLRIDTQLLDPDPEFADRIAEMTAGVGLDYIMEASSDDPHVSRLRHFLGLYKGEKVAKLLVEEIRDGAYDKIVVLAHHHDTLDQIEQALAGAQIEHVGFRGSTPQSRRQRAIDDFKGTKVPVFVAQQGAAGIAINLQNAHEIVLVEPSWSPSDNAQAIKRIHRIGQEEPCRARVFAVPDTLDDRIMERLAQKLRMITEVGL